MLTEEAANGRDRQLPKQLVLQMLRDHASAVLPMLVEERAKITQEVRELSDWIRQLREQENRACAIVEAIKNFLAWTDADEGGKVPF